MTATCSQLLGMRKARALARERGHLLHRFQETDGSKLGREDSQLGPEYVAKCRHCNAVVLVYFPFSRDELMRQGYDFEKDVIVVVSYRYGYESTSLMLVSGLHRKCGG